MEVIWCHPIGGETLVTDGRVDDQLVWWFQHSKLSAWLSVRVSQVVISVLLAGRRTVTEDVRWSISWPSQISGQPCWMEMSPMVGWPGWQWAVGWRMMEFTLHHSHVQIRPTPDTLEKECICTL